MSDTQLLILAYAIQIVSSLTLGALPALYVYYQCFRNRDRLRVLVSFLTWAGVAAFIWATSPLGPLYFGPRSH
jgi:hypothetical protein